MSSLPDEIYLDILLRVPVRSTFVCKCVCKSWFQLISDPDFVRTHLTATTQRNNPSLLVKTINGYRLYSSYDLHDDALFVELETPYKYLTYTTTSLLGSCNGLVYGWSSRLKLYFLWNPATKEYKRLPKSQPDDCYGGRYHGFGYDCKTDDHKLVDINHKHEHVFSVRVYSLKSDSWRSLQSGQYKFQLHESGVPFNGAIHWFGGIIGKTSSRIIVYMDINEERFEELQLPMTLPETQFYESMGVLDGCLCVLATNKPTFEVWVMQVYGVPESWTKLYTITYERIMCNVYFLELIGSFKNDEILFKDGHKVVSYDSIYGTARQTGINDLKRGGTVKYFESLVSLNTTTVAAARSKKRESTTILKKRNR